MDPDWAPPRVEPQSTRGLSGEVDIGAVGPAGVEPAFESRVDDQPDQRLAHLWHGQGPPLANWRHGDFPPRADRLGRNRYPRPAHPLLEPGERLDEGGLR